jgi:hypothetical protein
MRIFFAISCHALFADGNRAVGRNSCPGKTAFHRVPAVVFFAIVFSTCRSRVQAAIVAIFDRVSKGQVFAITVFKFAYLFFNAFRTPETAHRKPVRFIIKPAVVRPKNA